MKHRQLLRRLVRGALKNVSFADFVHLVEGYGFVEIRVSGSHHLFASKGLPEMLNIQEVKGEAKPYQIRQFLRLVECYNLRLKEGIE